MLIEPFHPDLIRGVATYALSFDAKRPVPTETADTIADGLSVRVPNPFSVEIINAGADRIIQVDDDETRPPTSLNSRRLPMMPRI